MIICLFGLGKYAYDFISQKISQIHMLFEHHIPLCCSFYFCFAFNYSIVYSIHHIKHYYVWLLKILLKRTDDVVLVRSTRRNTYHWDDLLRSYYKEIISVPICKHISFWVCLAYLTKEDWIILWDCEVLSRYLACNCNRFILWYQCVVLATLYTTETTPFTRQCSQREYLEVA